MSSTLRYTDELTLLNAGYALQIEEACPQSKQHLFSNLVFNLISILVFAFGFISTDHSQSD